MATAQLLTFHELTRSHTVSAPLQERLRNMAQLCSGEPTMNFGERPEISAELGREKAPFDLIRGGKAYFHDAEENLLSIHTALRDR